MNEYDIRPRIDELVAEVEDCNKVMKDILDRLEASVKEYAEFLKRSLSTYDNEVEAEYER